jgi:hypothetical protein
MSELRRRWIGLVERFGEPITVGSASTKTFPSVLSSAQARIYAENVSVDTSLRPTFLVVIRGDISVPSSVTWRGENWDVLASVPHSLLGVQIAHSLVVARPVP